MFFNEQRALDLLRLGTGDSSATFREGQEEAIRHLVEGKGRLLVVQKTGWGKSFVYFIATRLLREAGCGPALLVSPLLALMRNQIAAAERMGVRAAAIHSENSADWQDVEALLAENLVDILLISPERLANSRFREKVMETVAAQMSLLVIDEAHCISDWGHDFRPHYRLLEKVIGELPTDLRLLATTATANNRVMGDLATVLGPGLTVSRGALARPSLTLQTIRLHSQAERLAWLAEHIRTLPGSGIIYTLTVRDTEQVAKWLQQEGLEVASYSSETGEQREELERALSQNRLKALVATTALGMGYDKPDLAFVIHYQTPSSVVAYYQQVGRAGRALPQAYGVLLSSSEEKEINDWFIRTAFPTRDEAAQVLSALSRAPGGLSAPTLLASVNLSIGRIEKTLAMLSLESPPPVVKDDRRWRRTKAPLPESFWERADRLTAQRRHEAEQMQQYVDLPFGEHMAFLLRALDADAEKISPPTLPPLPETVDSEDVEKAVDFLRSGSLRIEPRSLWCAGGLPLYGAHGQIPNELMMEPGIALGHLYDSGWGSVVRDGKAHDQHFCEELVNACVKRYQTWQPQPAPTWVTCIPSQRYPELVPNFAQRLATALDLPFRAVIRKTANRPEQMLMANSIQQARNVDGSLALNVRQLLHEPVLLIDDIVDSRWTLTIAAWLLRRNGCGRVWPMVLAMR